MYRVLLLSDDWPRKKALKGELVTHGFTLTVASSTEFLREDYAPPSRLDLILLDLERCATDTAKLCHAVKREGALRDLPMVLLVTEAQLGQLDFGWGMDDYLTLPVTGKRLIERLHFLIWKLHRVSLKNGFSQGDLVIDFERYEVRVKGAPTDLTYKEFELLKYLATHPGKPLSRETLLTTVWGYDFYGGTRTVDVHIRRLRSKIERGGQIYIETVRNVGYKFLGEGNA